LTQFQNYMSSDSGEGTFEREGPFDRREGLIECVAFDPRPRQGDMIYEIRGLENQGSWTDPRRNVARVWTEDGMEVRW